MINNNNNNKFNNNYNNSTNFANYNNSTNFTDYNNIIQNMGNDSLDNLSLVQVNKITKSKLDKYLENNSAKSIIYEESFPNLFKETPVGELFLFDIIKQINSKLASSNELSQIINGTKCIKLIDLIHEELTSSYSDSSINPFTKGENFTNWQNRPFGEFGDNNLNDLTKKLINTDFNLLIKNLDINVKPLKPLNFFTAAFFYHNLVKLYAYKIFPITKVYLFKTDEDKLKFIRVWQMNIASFMFVTGPLITLALLSSVNHLIFEEVNLNLHKVSTSDTSIIQESSIIKNITLFSLFKNNIGPKFFKIILTIIILISLLIYFIGLETLFLYIINININWMYFKLFWIFAYSLYYIYFFIILFLYSLFNKNDITIPTYLPFFIKNWLDIIKHLSKSQGYWFMIRIYLSEICFVIFVLALLIWSL
jgi:hypothetical protein